jgi:hypothetical protein
MDALSIQVAVIIGIILALIGNVVAALMPDYFRVKLDPSCEKWNEKYVMEVSLFATGALSFLLLESAGAIDWYNEKRAETF